MRGKSLSDSQPVRRFLHFVIQHEFLKKEHSLQIPPWSLSFTTFWRHLHPFFYLFFFPATSGCGRSCQSWTSLRRRWRWMSWKRRKQTQWMPKLRRSIRKKERKRSLGIWEEFHQGHRLNRRFLWSSGEKNTFELGRYFWKKRWADPGFACIFFFGTDPSEMQWTSRKAT